MKAAAIAVVGSILAAIVKRDAGAIALAVALICCCTLVSCLLGILKPLLRFLEELRADLRPEYYHPVSTFEVGGHRTHHGDCHGNLAATRDSRPWQSLYSFVVQQRHCMWRCR